MDVKTVSVFFCNNSPIDHKSEIVEEFLKLIDKANIYLSKLHMPLDIKCIYNPTEYARITFELYVKKYCSTKKHIMFFGMNPGPWGMSQTGVPFGEVTVVRDWLGISGPVGKPQNEIKERPVKGFECSRTEISGKRFWGLIKDLSGTPEKFFASSFVYNYLNQQWMRSNGSNITPGDFKVSEMQPLYNICDPILIDVIKLYEVKVIVAIGKFCETRAQKALEKYLPFHSIQVHYLPHPSPRTINNNNWDKKALECLKKFDLLQYYT
ncbi:single-strand selective monofunctional uracil DNA glycosylase [Aricia agestis]|uniref:single-strand selective monofunctional uracil DNA glycosylase n=1 Tax=Aricia agestis TaxID=91739 RepID=UPI001C20A741|nr:single-strand selective monofunctional uracil DNA glycosylase [Aricia agestis]